MINHYNKATQDSPSATEHFIDSLKAFIETEFDEDILMPIIDCDFSQVDVAMSTESKKKAIDENFSRVA